jgi:RpiR family murPQ operon transcriptional repressor
MKLSSVYSTLPPAERKVADFILANPDEASHMVINEIAHRAGVSVPSVTRLARKLGYSGFMDFRVSLASGSAAVKSDSMLPISSTDSDEELIKKLMVGHMNAIESTLKVLDAKKLAEFANKIIDADRVVWFGIGGCTNLASSLSNLLCNMGIDSIVMNNRYIMKRYAKNLGENDVAAFLTRTGRTQVTLDTLAAAKEAGATTALFTNLVNSPGEEFADYFFCTSRQDDLYRVCSYETATAMCALLESLLIVIGRRKRLDANLDLGTAMKDEK